MRSPAVAGVLALGLLLSGRAMGEGQRRPHVFIYLVDALRADHLGCYGYGRPVSPNVDAFAKEATVFRAIAPSSWTKASVASLLTGRSPILHRAQDRGDTLPDDAVTLAELMAAAGYRTYALYANTWVSETFGMDQGFEESRLLPARSDSLTGELSGRLRRLAPADRLFAYVHTIDPHAPYEPTPEYRRMFAPPGSTLARVSAVWLEEVADRARRGEPAAPRVVEEVTALYDAEIAFNDRQFGLFLEELRRRRLYDDSLVLFTSDHGEELFDHGGVAHGHTLFREVLEVPLIVKWPRGEAPAPGTNRSTAQLLDVLPTVLDCAGLPAPPGLQGRSLLRARPAAARSGRGSGILSYLDLDGLKLQSVTEGRWKLVRDGALDAARPRLDLYDLDEGREANDVRGLHPALAAHLASELEIGGGPAPAHVSTAAGRAPRRGRREAQGPGLPATEPGRARGAVPHERVLRSCAARTSASYRRRCRHPAAGSPAASRSSPRSLIAGK